ncbi:adenylosuccinate lyase [Candidatus Roizmanbacteria bacterium]|nr:adenylosuccinate lyase [Candidatus Roizmanbacteria bacterium]
MKHLRQSFNSTTEEAITPIDGRYRNKVQELAPFFSEYALQKYRIFVELQYLQELSIKGIIPKMAKSEIASMNRIVDQFSPDEFKGVKKIELKIIHDVKAVEYYLREKFLTLNLKKYLPYIHIGLTSEDVSNLAQVLILNDANKQILVPLLKELLLDLKVLAESTKNIPILGRTHGQPAVPTTFGKEIINYYHRLKKQVRKIEIFEFEGKCNGAVGNFNALEFIYRKVDWVAFSNQFVASLGLTSNPATTQILPYDNWIEFFQILTLVNGILVDFSTNVWLYIMLEILVQKKNTNEVGSSTMPQKVNPINFENAEGALQVANAQYELYARKLPVSRLQRDLSDSIVRRTFGNAIAYTVLGWKSVMAGLKKISLNKEKVKKELDDHWEVLAEALQTYLRSTGDEKAYEKLKKLTQGKIMTKERYKTILKELGLEKDKKFTDLSPEKYVGLAEKLVEIVIKN